MPLYRHVGGKKGFIYVLIDPRDETVNYVGQTVCPGRRREEHAGRSRYRRGTNFSLNKWKDDLKEHGLEPRLVVVEIMNRDKMDAREASWIAYYRMLGDIFNILPGAVKKKKPKRKYKVKPKGPKPEPNKTGIPRWRQRAWWLNT
jgi:hypothetical protein